MVFWANFIKFLITLNENLNKKINILAIDLKFDHCDIYTNKYVERKIRHKSIK